MIRDLQDLLTGGGLPPVVLLRKLASIFNYEDISYARQAEVNYWMHYTTRGPDGVGEFSYAGIRGKLRRTTIDGLFIISPEVAGTIRRYLVVRGHRLAGVAAEGAAVHSRSIMGLPQRSAARLLGFNSTTAGNVLGQHWAEVRIDGGVTIQLSWFKARLGPEDDLVVTPGDANVEVRAGFWGREFYDAESGDRD